MRIKLLIISVLLAASLYSQDSVSVFECYKLMEKNFPVAAQKELYNQINSLKIKNITTNWLPSADLTMQATYQSDVPQIGLNIPIPGFQADIPVPNKDQYKIAIDINQVIYDGGITASRRQLEESLNSVIQYNNDIELYNLRDKINQAYFGILVLQKTIEQINLAITELNYRLKNLESGISHGVVMGTAADLIKVEILKLSQQRITLESEINAMFKILNVLTASSFDRNTKLTIPEIADTVVVEINRPEFKAFDARMKSNETTIELSSKSRLPKLIGFAQLGYGNPGLNMLNNEFDTYYIVGARLAWKIYDWNQTRREKQIIKLQNQIIDNQKDIFNKNIEIAAARELQKLDKLNQLIESDRQICSLRRSIRIKSASALENGTITPAEYISDVNNELQAAITMQLHIIQKSETKVNLIYIYGN